MVWQPSSSILSTDSHDTSWYFNNTTPYHMLYDLKDFKNPTYLQPCILSQDDITLTDKSVIFLESIRKVWFNFKVSDQTD